MTFDPEQWRERWLTTLTAVTALILGVGVLIYEVGWGRDPEFGWMAVTMIAGSPAAIAASHRK